MLSTIFLILSIFIAYGLVFFLKSKFGGKKKSPKSVEDKAYFKSGFINTTKLPKCQKVDEDDFYYNFIGKTPYNEKIKNKRCGDTFQF